VRAGVHGPRSFLPFLTSVVIPRAGPAQAVGQLELLAAADRAAAELPAPMPPAVTRPDGTPGSAVGHAGCWQWPGLPCGHV